MNERLNLISKASEKHQKTHFHNSKRKQLIRLQKHFVSKIEEANKSKNEEIIRHYLRFCSQIEKQINKGGSAK